MQVHRYDRWGEERMTRLHEEQIAIWRIAGVEPVSIAGDISHRARKIKSSQKFAVGAKGPSVSAHQR